MLESLAIVSGSWVVVVRPPEGRKATTTTTGKIARNRSMANAARPEKTNVESDDFQNPVTGSGCVCEHPISGSECVCENDMF